MNWHYRGDLRTWKDAIREAPIGSRASASIFGCSSKVFIFTIHFYDEPEKKNIVRERCNNGQIEHLLPRAYDGNALSSEGSLVFIPSVVGVVLRNCRS
jgi:hypothetical protein